MKEGRHGWSEDDTGIGGRGGARSYVAIVLVLLSFISNLKMMKEEAVDGSGSGRGESSDQCLWSLESVGAVGPLFLGSIG